jgi:hypothetical protein
MLLRHETVNPFALRVSKGEVPEAGIYSEREESGFESLSPNGEEQFRASVLRHPLMLEFPTVRPFEARPFALSLSKGGRTPQDRPEALEGDGGHPQDRGSRSPIRSK